ncbi:MAG: DNA mismatch repair endonuclease MutL [Candidatus Choladocola sp.]|nr:DNA mismatch repair endonuclease MutL [Candidatus Choladocola sp.]
MNQITLLSQDTIDKIAAGEVVERPASIVKELVENAVDAGANAVTVEIRDGGISLVRITDNGSGIPKDQVQVAFLRHATSKIRTVEDLLTSGTLGFRGEALSSIAAVCQVEMITKTSGSLTGIRYVIEGGEEKTLEEIGAPEGTTFLVRNLFYHTPARKKFLKTAATEAGYVSDLMERMALSHPEISFKFINNRDTKLHTSGNCNLKDIIYSIYGRDIAANVVKIDTASDGITVSGYIGKPVISRGNRNYENYFVNGRYVKSAIISRAIEDAYRPFMMNHRYPFTVLTIEINTDQVDVNVHPTKMEVRFADQNRVYDHVYQAVKEGLIDRELIPEFTVDAKKQHQNDTITELKNNPENNPNNNRENLLANDAKNSIKKERKTDVKPSYPEPFEKIRSQLIAEADSPYEIKYPQQERRSGTIRPVTGNVVANQSEPVQQTLFDSRLLSAENRKKHKLIGQLFDTYWLVEFDETLYIIDQHAAHEKVMYERFMKDYEKKRQTSQMITPPLIVTLSMQEETVLKQNMEHFTAVGFEIEHFGGKEYSIRAVPGNLYGIADRELFLELLDGLNDISDRLSDQAVREKIASMSCKAAVKGNHKLSAAEADALIGELLTLENPYNCPHGRPTIISMTKYELEKKFKRIL